ncbi:hypothetical protein [Brevundimonas sp. Marseille-Q4549]
MTDSPCHPSFPQPESPSVSLWRYMDFPRFEWMAENERLFIPTADNLGDPLEGTTPQAEIDWWDRELANADTEERRKTILHNRSFFAHFAEAFRKNYYVTCWHMNEFENNVMWGAYTRTKEAVAIRTTYGDLQRNLPAFALLGVVRYLDYSSQPLPDRTNMFEWIMHKEALYAGECEVRAVIFPPHDEAYGLADFNAHHFTKIDDPNFRLFAPPINLSEIVQQVIIHPEAAPEFREKVEALCRSKGLPSPTQSRRHRTPVF